MDIVEEAMKVLTGGLEQSGTKMVALGTSAAARALWNKVRTAVKRSTVQDPEGLATAEPGTAVEPSALRELLQQLHREDHTVFMSIVHGDVHGDVVMRDKHMHHGD